MTPGKSYYRRKSIVPVTTSHKKQQTTFTLALKSMSLALHDLNLLSSTTSFALAQRATIKKPLQSVVRCRVANLLELELTFTKLTLQPLKHVLQTIRERHSMSN